MDPLRFMEEPLEEPRQWADEKPKGLHKLLSPKEAVKNLRSLLALPLDINELKHFLRIDGKLRKHRMTDGSSDSSLPLHKVVPFQEPDWVLDSMSFTPLQDPHAIMCRAPASEDKSTSSPLSYLGVVFVVIVFMVRLKLMRAWEKRREAKSPSRPPLLIRTGSRNGSHSNANWGDESFNKKNEDVSSPSKGLEQERLENLIDQNRLLRTVLEEQKLSIQRLSLELLERDRGLSKLEATQDQQMRDLSAQLLALSNSVQQERVERSKQELEPEKAPEWRDAIVRRLDVITEIVNKKTEGKDVQNSLKAIKCRLEGLEAEQQRHRADISELEDTKQQVNSLSQQLPAVKKELEVRSIQMTKLGQYLKTRDEQDGLKIENLKKDFEDLASKFRFVSDEVNCQQEDTSDLKKNMKANHERMESQIWDIQKQLLAQETALRGGQEEQENIRNQCATLEERATSLASSCERIYQSVGECRSMQAENADEIKALNRQFQSQEKQVSSMANTINEISTSMEDMKANQREQEQTSQTQKEELASQIRDMVVELQIKHQKQKCMLEALAKQFSEAKTEQKTFQENQELQLHLLRAALERRLSATIATIESLARDLAQLKNDTSRDDQISKLELCHATLATKVQEAVDAMQERMDFELVTNHAHYEAQISYLQSSLEELNAQQQGLSTMIQEVGEDGVSRIQAITEDAEAISKNLQGSIDAVKRELETARSKSAEQAKQITIATRGRQELAFQLQELQKSSQQERDTEEYLRSQIAALVVKVDDLERHQGNSRADYEQRCVQLSGEIGALSAEVDKHHQQAVSQQSQIEYQMSEVRSALQQLVDWAGVHDATQQESLGKFEGEYESLQARLEELCIKLDDHELRQNELLRQHEFQNELSSVHEAFALMNEEEERREMPQKHREEVEVKKIFGDDEHDDDSCAVDAFYEPNTAVQHKKDSSQSHEFFSLSTKLIAFNVELERRDQAVFELEEYTKEKSDAYSSRAEVLNNEIEQQRSQLKKWEELTQTNESRRTEMGEKLRKQGLETAQLQDELHEIIEDLTEIEDALQEDEICSGLKSRLQSRLKVQKDRRNEMSKRIEESKATASLYEAEYSTLGAKQELFEEELDRRKTRLSALRSSLRNVLDLVAVERAALQQKLVHVREERESWKEKTRDLYLRLQSVQGEHLDLSGASILFSEGSNAGIITKNEQDETANREDILGENSGEKLGISNQEQPAETSKEHMGSLGQDVLRQIEALRIEVAKAEDRREDAIVKTKQALDAEIEKSREQHIALARKVEQIAEGLDSRDALEEKVDALQRELENGGRRLVGVSNEQNKLAGDLKVRVDSLQKDIQALAAVQQALALDSKNSRNVTCNEDPRFDVLNEKMETLAAHFSDYGDLVAQAGALADSIQRCEGQLQRFENEKEDFRSDVSAMIDFFKSDLLALKQSFDENLHDQDTEFSKLLSKVENLANITESQEKQIEEIENRLQDEKANGEGGSSSKPQIQAEHILQQMNEKYIDLATKVDLLANEMLASGKRDQDMESRAKDRDALYLSQMEAVRRDLESQQARFQDQMQMKVYHTMVNVFNALAKRQGIASPFLSWNADKALEGPDRKDGNEETKESEGERKQLMTRNWHRDRDGRGFRWRPRGTMGYSMASGMITDNMYTVMMASQHARSKADEKGGISS